MIADSKTQLAVRSMTPQDRYDADRSNEPWVEPGTQLVGLIKAGDSDAFNKLQAYAVIVSRGLTSESTPAIVGQLTLDLDQKE
jgi:hypothetical protein